MLRECAKPFCYLTQFADLPRQLTGPRLVAIFANFGPFMECFMCRFLLEAPNLLADQVRCTNGPRFVTRDTNPLVTNLFRFDRSPYSTAGDEIERPFVGITLDVEFEQIIRGRGGKYFP